MLTMYLAMLGTEEDRERFTLLYEAYEKRLYAVALKILANPAQAEDAAQQAWLQVLRNWERVKELEWESAGKYLAVAAKNAALDLLKKERWTASMPEEWNPPAPEDGESEYRRLVALILSLPEAVPPGAGAQVCDGGEQPGHPPPSGDEESRSHPVQRAGKLLLEAMDGG